MIARLGAAAVASFATGVGEAAATDKPEGPAKYDILIAGGHVIDPVSRTSGIRDVAIANGKVASVAANLPRVQARQVIDASGKLVTPGLIDMHGHVYDQAIQISIDPDIVGIPKGVTTIVDCGSSGAGTFPGFRKYVIERARTRVYALLNISTIGLVVANELYLDPKMIDAKAAIQTIEGNRDLILGIKVRINGRDEEVPHDMNVLKTAREASDATGVPIMMHWTNDRRLLSMLKKGDILAHPFNPSRAGPNCLGPDGKVLPQILELKDRGIFTDFSHGGHLQWETAQKAAEQGWFPDTISTDIHRAHVAPNGLVIDLLTTMSKFLYLGLPLDQVIEKTTAAPMRILNFPERLGSLEPGITADVSILTLEDGSFDFFDSTRQKRTGNQRLFADSTIKGGRVYPTVRSENPVVR
ncbi:MAG TPA: amidohydrolase/deacetylase family metallohydrolase [Bryobacteraceae bacterium]|nr:amidohydrolase/deacetylase family metallohydrolase [Bryobacteraceae bacterium]